MTQFWVESSRPSTSIEAELWLPHSYGIYKFYEFNKAFDKYKIFLADGFLVTVIIIAIYL